LDKLQEYYGPELYIAVFPESTPYAAEQQKRPFSRKQPISAAQLFPHLHTQLHFC